MKRHAKAPSSGFAEPPAAPAALAAGSSIAAGRGSRGLFGMVCLFAVGLAALLGSGAPAAAAAPPDGRAYELVSPVDKLGAIPNFPVDASDFGFVGFSALTAASGDGNRLLWMSVGAFGDATNGMQASYESIRTEDGWTTRQVSPDPVSDHPMSLLSKAVILDATEDLARRVIPSNEEFDPLIQGGLGGALKRNLFLQDDELNLTWISRPNAGPSTELTNALYEGSDVAMDHIVFGTLEALTPNAVGLFGKGLYDHTGGQTVLVNVDNGGNPVNACGAVLGRIPQTFDDGGITRDAVSSDGSRIAFTAPDPTSGGEDPSCSEPARIYVRKNGATAEASADQRTVPDLLVNEPADFQGAADAGVDKVFFTSDRALTDSALNGTNGRPLLYEYDVDSGVLTLITPNNVVTPFVVGVLANAEDGSDIYFIARGQLTPDAPASLSVRKLYRYAGGQFTYIATVTTAEALELTAPESFRQVRITPDGDHFVFQVASSLAGFNTAGTHQLYLYDAPEATLTCISCPADGSDPAGDAWLTQDDIPPLRQYQAHNITSDGQRIFFDSLEAHVPQDDNGVYDVYEWEEGELKLISKGHGTEPSFFADSANEGDDLFFVTADRLTPHDVDNDLDFYDARVGGGFPAPPETPAPCVGDQCQGQPTAPPALSGAMSQTEFGEGNLGSVRKAAKRCRSGQRKVRRGGKVRCAGKKRENRANHDRRASR